MVGHSEEMDCENVCFWRSSFCFSTAVDELCSSAGWCYLCSVMLISPLTVIMKGTVLIISRMNGTRNTCSQTLPWKHRPHSEVRKVRRLWIVSINHHHHHLDQQQITERDPNWSQRRSSMADPAGVWFKVSPVAVFMCVLTERG